MQNVIKRPFRPSLVMVALALTIMNAGCSPLTITALGIGGTAGVNHAMNGVVYRTFTAPINNVRLASMEALKRMGIGVGASKKQKDGELIVASAADREIEIELEVISANTTRMRSVAKKNAFLYDSATATEIIEQTEKSLKPAKRPSSRKEFVAQS